MKLKVWSFVSNFKVASRLTFFRAVTRSFSRCEKMACAADVFLNVVNTSIKSLSPVRYVF